MREVGLHCFVVLLQAGIDEFSAVLLDVGENFPVARCIDVQLVGYVRSDLETLPLRVLVVRVPNQRLHFDQIDHALEVLFRSDRQLRGQGTRTEALLDHIHATQKIRAAAVHLVDIANTRHAVVVGQTPIGFRLRLHARHAVEHHHGPVENPQRAVDLDGEIDVARRIDEIDFLVAPKCGHGGALNRDAALLFLFEIVGGRRRLQILGIVNVDDGVLTPRVVQDALRRRRLAGVDVGDDADIANIGKGRCAGHSEVP